ncbi:pyridoxal-phosphate dependent enzyme, partial [Myxococcota bacterium]|nr:pyridoxal-phosphate dependent enzyme [Myxococcota bacterium]
MNRHILDKECIVCHRTYGMDEVELTCPQCGIEGILDVRYDYEYIRGIFTDHLKREPRQDIFRYGPLLPLRRGGRIPVIPVGPTPLYKVDRMAKKLGMTSLYVKDDGRLPTASFKDRASAIAVARAHELGISLICAASTGNAAASLAGLTAPEGITSVIFVPESAPPAKIAQLLTFGAKVFAVRGSYDDAFELSMLAAKKYNWYSRSTAVNPLLSEGKKTGA